jgi:hypothetical protein
VQLSLAFDSESEAKSRTLLERFLSTLSFDVDDPTEEAAILEKTRAALSALPLVDLEEGQR